MGEGDQRRRARDGEVNARYNHATPSSGGLPDFTVSLRVIAAFLPESSATGQTRSEIWA